MFKGLSLAIGLASVMLSSSAAQQNADPGQWKPARGSDLSTRVDALLAAMTPEEKTGQMMQYFQFFPDTRDVERKAKDGQIGSLLFMTDLEAINRVQHAAVEGSRLHIPLMFGFDVIHGWRTIFPVPLAMASSWEPDLVAKAQAEAASEARAAGINWTFAPMVDIARDARWGRIVEGAGEDPFLGSAMAAAQVRGFQGESIGAPGHLLATVKHFAAYGAAEGGRDYDSTYVPDVLLWNTYFPPYKAAIDAGAGSVMSAYQELNDIPASGNRWLLQHVLRDQWKFNGLVVSDASAVYNLTTQGYSRDPEDAAYRAFTAGVNMEMGVPDLHIPANSEFGNKEAVNRPGEHTYDVSLLNLLRQGRISNQQLDDMVRPILTAKIRLGLFEHPYVDPAEAEAVVVDRSHRDFARVVAQRSMVLLKNQGSVLPLSKSVRSVAVIGTLADSGLATMGSWVFQGRPEEAVTILQGIRNKLPGSPVTFVRGAEIKRPFPNPVALVKEDISDQSEAQLERQIEEAVATTAKADVAVVVLGERQDMSGESASRASLDFPGQQLRLLQAVTAVGKPIVLVLLNGRPLDLSWASEHVPAILEAWYPGSEGGNAVADILFGDANPSGKLPVTWPRSAGQAPLYYAHNLTKAPETSADFKSRYWDELSFPLFPFGFGLSYSTFRVSNVQLDKSSIDPTGSVNVSVDVQNVGKIAGEDIVQLYLHQRAGSASRPVRQLKGFQKVALAPGEKKTLHFNLGPQQLRFWSPATKSWAVESERFDVWVGEDATAQLHAEFRVSASR